MKTGPRPYTFCLILYAALLLAACKAIIEPSISDRQVIALAPGDQSESASYAVNFWWEPVEDALSYNLQVVSPGFHNIASLVADTIVGSHKFMLNMKPGEYQWRVSARNGSSQTKFSSARSFTILLSSIKGQSVQLIAPNNNFITNQNAINLQWSTLYGAKQYLLQIDTNNFTSESTMVFNKAIPGTQFNFTFPKDHSYQWRVRAENDTAKADWSGVNTVLHDRTPPGPVTILSPANNQQIPLPVSMQWNAVVSAIKYKLSVFKSDSVTAYNNSFPMLLNGTSYSFNAGALGERVVWKVSAIDAAGNEGQPSGVRSFVVR